MAKRLPRDAFEFYYTLGADRSYQSVAHHFGVVKQTVVKRATKEHWKKRVAELDEKAREKREAKLLESLEEMNVRHIKLSRAIQARAVETLRQMPLSTAMEAVRASEAAIKLERLIRGEPSERTVISTEEILRKEHQKWIATSEPDFEGEIDETK